MGGLYYPVTGRGARFQVSLLFAHSIDVWREWVIQSSLSERNSA
jgi:hypothetical protein